MTLCAADDVFGASWTDDDSIVFGRGVEGIWEVSANGGEPRNVLPGTNGAIYQDPQKPFRDERTLLVTVGKGIADWDAAEIVVVDLETGDRNTVVRGGSDARYLPTGHLVYATGSTLFAVGFDPRNLDVIGGPVPVIEGVRRPGGRETAAAQFSFAEDGTLVYVPGLGDVERELVWIDASGGKGRLTEKTRAFSTPRWSPDGSRLAVTVVQDGSSDVWILDIARDTLTQLTRDGTSQYPDWSPDGEWLVFSSGSPSDLDLFRIRSEFSTSAEPLLQREGIQMHPRWIPDGTGIVFQEGFADAADLWVLDLDGDGEARLFLQTPVNEAQPDVSPDGRFIAYHSNVSGNQTQIFVQPFPGPGERKQISTDGGASPRWSPDGREIFYLDYGRQAIVAVEVRTEPAIEAGTPRLLFEWPIGRAYDRQWDVAPDGERFVVRGTSETKGRSRPRIHFVLNWFDELERLVPTRGR